MTVDKVTSVAFSGLPVAGSNAGERSVALTSNGPVPLMVHATAIPFSPLTATGPWVVAFVCCPRSSENGTLIQCAPGAQRALASATFVR
jgi:hypothetical protein